jgi:CRP/FNR family transcriptional regulator
MATSLALTKDQRPRHPPFAPPSPADAFAKGVGLTITAKPGQTIVVEGDPADHCYRIVSGTVRLYQSIADGRRQVIDFLSDGDVFGLTGVEHHALSVEAVSRVVVIRYPRRWIEPALESNPELARRMFQLACVELRRAQRQMLLLGRKTADERIASFLLRLAESAEGSLSRVISLSMPRLDIADHLGLTIETVSRTFSRLRREGLIGLPSRHEVELKQIGRLRAIAEGESARAA